MLKSQRLIVNLIKVYNFLDIVEHWEKKLLESPNDGLAHDELGKAYFVKDEKDKSYHHLRRAIALKSYDHLTTYLLALIYESRGAFKDAIYYLVDTIEREPTFLKA